MGPRDSMLTLKLSSEDHSISGVWAGQDNRWVAGTQTTPTGSTLQLVRRCRLGVSSCDIVSDVGVKDWADVSGLPDGRVFLAARDGSVVHYDGFVAIERKTPAGLLNRIHARTETDVWAVGESGHVVHWDGTQWRDVPHPAGHGLVDVASAEGATWILGTENRLLRRAQ